MRIVITSNYRLGNESGTAKVAELLCKYLSKHNEIVYICLGNNFNIQKNKYFTIVKIPSIEITKIFVPVITPVVMYQVFELLDSFKPEIIHAQNPFFVCTLTQTWARIKNVPFVVTFHHIPTQALAHAVPLLSKNILVNLVQDLYSNTTLKKFLSNSNGVIALNKSVYNSIKSIDNYVATKIISNGVELKKLNKLKILDDGTKNKRFIFLGSYVERKNQMMLAKVFRFLPKEFKLYCFGNIETGKEYYDSIVKYIKSKNIKNVYLNNYTDNISKEFSKSNYFISASIKEAQSLVILQALGAGKPIIGIENETINELVNKKNGLVISKKITPKQFAKKIIDFVNNSNYVELSKHSKKDSKRFDIELVTLEIQKFYKEIANSLSKKC